MEFLTVTDIRKSEGDAEVLKGITFTQPEHRRLAIVGESGSGKSTLLKIIAGFAQPTAGNVRFQDKRVRGPEEQLIAGHPGIAYLSQHFELRNNYRVEELLSMNNQLSEAEAGRIYEVCRITPFLQRRTNQVSGGEKQRIALARLLVGAPRLLLLDGPFSNLDLIHRGVLKAVIRDIGERLGLTVLMVSHDPMDTLPWADEIKVMRAGAIVQTATPVDVYRKPVDTYVAGLFGDYNLIGEQRRFVRPADIRIGEGPVAGAIIRASFLGDVYELAVDTSAGPVTAHTRRNDLHVGDTVSLGLPDEPGWFI